MLSSAVFFNGKNKTPLRRICQRDEFHSKNPRYHPHSRTKSGTLLPGIITHRPCNGGQPQLSTKRCFNSELRGEHKHTIASGTFSQGAISLLMQIQRYFLPLHCLSTYLVYHSKSLFASRFHHRIKSLCAAFPAGYRFHKRQAVLPVPIS